MTILLAAAVLIPSLFWDKGPSTAQQLKDAGIREISVPSASAASWSGVSGIKVTGVDVSAATKITAPAMRYRRHMAAATSAPWVDSNGWRFLRDPSGTYLYDAPGNAVLISAAEAFAYGVRAFIHTDDAGLEPLGKMLSFLCRVTAPQPPSRVNIGFIDDGSPESAEFMNLLVRRNLLFRVVKTPDPTLDLNVKPGSPEYPKSEAGNPSLLAERVRSNLTDEKRLLRVYGSETVIGRLNGTGMSGELYLLNYGGARRSVNGLRVRVLGGFKHETIHDFDAPNETLSDIAATPQATEFTLKNLSVFAVVDLTQ